MSHNVIICTLNSQYIHSSLAPWCLLSGIKQYAGSSVRAKVIESTVNDKSEKVLFEIIKEAPLVIGFCCYIWNIEQILRLARKVKSSLPACRVVLGGPEVSYNPKEVLSENPDIDYITCGEGERPFALLCKKLTNNDTNSILDIPGLCFRTENGYHLCEPNIEKGDAISPYCDEYMENLHGRISYIEGSRGCPFSCAFCLSGRCGSVRYFDIERTKENLLKLCASGTKTVKFVDRTFNADKKRAIEIWNFIKEEYGKRIPRGVCIHFEIGGDLLSKECFEVLCGMPAGSIQLEIGIQSFNEKTLSSINRKTNTERLSENIKRLVSFRNIHIHIDLIAGLPHEDYESFILSFNKAFALGANMLQLGFLKLLHGADMREHANKYPCKYSHTAPYEVISTPWLSGDEIKKLRLVDNANDKICNSGRFRRSFAYVLECIRKSPFDVLLDFAIYLESLSKESLSLFELSEFYYKYFSGFSEIDNNILADKMILDFFARSRYGKLPAFLKRQDKRIKAVLEYLSANQETAKKEGAVRCAAILYGENRAVYCDSAQSRELDAIFKNPVSDEYFLRFVELSEIFDSSSSDKSEG